MKERNISTNDKLVVFDHMEDLTRVHKKNANRKKIYDDLEPVFEAIGEFIRLRSERKISQKQLEALTAVSQANISRFENGKVRNFSIAYLSRLVKPLGYRPRVVFEKW